MPFIPACRRVVRLVLLPLLVMTAACEDPFGPQSWDATPDTAALWSASRLELLEQPAAFDFALAVAPVWIEFSGASNSWDVVLIDHQGRLSLAPASYFAGQGTRAGIAVLPNATLESVTSAPRDSASFLRTPVPLELNTVYVVRTRQAVCEGGFSSGTRYAKLRALAIDQQAGTISFELVRNPYCSSRSFIPPEDND
jgi:hypothetical protein